MKPIAAAAAAGGCFMIGEQTRDVSRGPDRRPCKWWVDGTSIDIFINLPRISHLFTNFQRKNGV